MLPEITEMTFFPRPFILSSRLLEDSWLLFRSDTLLLCISQVLELI